MTVYNTDSDEQEERNKAAQSSALRDVDSRSPRQDDGAVWRHTVDGTAYAPAPDALWRLAPTPIVANYSVLGLRLALYTNSPDIHRLMDDLFPKWPAGANASSELSLKTFLHDPQGNRHDAGSAPPIARMQREYLMISRGNSFGFADRVAGFATAFLESGITADGIRAQVDFLECLTLFLASRPRPVTLHAAAVIWKGRCILLTGVSGAGKSTLAYACYRRGLEIVAEDVVFAQPLDVVESVSPQGPLEDAGQGSTEAKSSSPYQEEGRGEVRLGPAGGPWIWGNAPYIHLMPGSERFFPEVAGMLPVRLFNGEAKLRIGIRERTDQVRSHTVWGVCSLARTAGPGSMILTADREHLRRSLTRFTGDPPFDQVITNTFASRLASGRAAHLVSGNDPAESVDLLQRWIESE